MTLRLRAGASSVTVSLGSATGQHGWIPRFGIYSPFLRLEAFDGGGDDLSIQFRYGHVDSCSIRSTSRKDHCTSGQLIILILARDWTTFTHV